MAIPNCAPSSCEAHQIRIPMVLLFSILLLLIHRTASLSHAQNADAAHQHNALAPGARSSWLPGENITFVLQHDFNATFFFVEDAPTRGIDPIRAFLLRAEGNIRSLFHHLLYAPGCKAKEARERWGNGCAERTTHARSKKRVVLDIGSNRGWYTLMAAAYGHTVYSFDPQPHCSLLLRSAVMMNEFQQRVYYTHAFVSDENTQMHVRKRTGCMGGFPNNNHAGYADSFRRPLDAMPGANETELVRSVRLDDIFDAQDVDVLLLKIDVEGHESHALASGLRLISSGAVRNIVMEFNLPMLSRQPEGIVEMKRRSLELVRRLMELGYRAKSSHKGAWNEQDEMKFEEWNKLFSAERDAFVTIDVWFYK